jgi:hypothetical protein
MKKLLKTLLYCLIIHNLFTYDILNYQIKKGNEHCHRICKTLCARNQYDTCNVFDFIQPDLPNSDYLKCQCTAEKNEKGEKQSGYITVSFIYDPQENSSRDFLLDVCKYIQTSPNNKFGEFIIDIE